MSNESSNKFPIHAAQGLLAGILGASGIQAFRVLNKLNQDRRDDEKLKAILLANAVEDSDKETKQANAFGDFFEGVGTLGSKAWETVGSPAVNYFKEPVQEHALANLLLLGAGGAGIYGLNELVDNIRKEDEKTKADAIREYYYSRLLETQNNENREAQSVAEPLRRKAANDGTSLLSLIAFASYLGIPLSTAYITKQYLDETMPGTSQPAAKNVPDPRAQIRRVERVDKKDEEEDLEPAIKMFDGIGKAASVGFAEDKAFETTHILRTVLANKEAAAKSFLPDIVRAIELNGYEELCKRAEMGLEEFGLGAEQFVKEASNGPQSTPQTRHIAVDLIAADPILSAATKPMAAAEFVEQYPTSIKAASKLRPEAADTCMAFIKAAAVEEDVQLLGEPKGDPVTLQKIVSVNRDFFKTLNS
jgi:hypothetical protein